MWAVPLPDTVRSCERYITLDGDTFVASEYYSGSRVLHARMGKAWLTAYVPHGDRRGTSYRIGVLGTHKHRRSGVRRLRDWNEEIYIPDYVRQAWMEGAKLIEGPDRDAAGLIKFGERELDSYLEWAKVEV